VHRDEWWRMNITVAFMKSYPLHGAANLVNQGNQGVGTARVNIRMIDGNDGERGRGNAEINGDTLCRNQQL